MLPRKCYYYCASADEAWEMLQLLYESGYIWRSGNELTDTSVFQHQIKPQAEVYLLISEDGVCTYSSRVAGDYDWPVLCLEDARRIVYGEDFHINNIDDLL